MGDEIDLVIQIANRQLRLPRWVKRVWVRDAVHLLAIANPIVTEATLVKQRTKSGINWLASIGKKYRVAINSKSEVYSFKDDSGTHIIEWCVSDEEDGGWIPIELLDIDQSTPPSHAQGTPQA